MRKVERYTLSFWTPFEAPSNSKRNGKRFEFDDWAVEQSRRVSSEVKVVEGKRGVDAFGVSMALYWSLNSKVTRQSDRQSRQSIANLTTSHKVRQVRFDYQLVDETVICIPKTRDCSTQINLHRHLWRGNQLCNFSLFLLLIIQFFIYQIFNYIKIIPIIIDELA